MSFIAEGDSINYGYMLSSPSAQCAWAQIYNQAPVNGMGVGTYFNYATTGAVLFSGPSSPLVSIYDRYMTNVYPHRPTANGGDGGSIAILFNNGGINDIASGRTATQLLADMVAYNTRAKADGFTIWADTLLPMSTPSYDGPRMQVNAAILAGHVGADLTFNSAQALPDCFDQTVFLPDGTHPILKGHTQRAAYMSGKIGSSAPDPWEGQVAFAANSTYGGTATTEIANYNCPRLNRGNAFDCVSGRFTAQKAGTMQFQFIGLNQGNAVQCKLEIRNNGQMVGNAAFAMSAYGTLNAIALTNVEVGDVISAWITNGSLLNSPTQTLFSGRLI